MDVKLVVMSGKRPGQEVSVVGPKFFIGRASDCHLRPQSELVSRHHCVILVEEGLAAVRDFGSRNGTFLNGEQLKTEQELKTGDRLKVGPLEFEVHLGVEVGGKKKPKVQSIQEAAARTVDNAAVEDDDLDISDWLEEDEDEASAESSQHDKAAAQTAIGQSLTETKIIPSESPQPQQDQKKQKQEKAKGIGRFQVPKKPTTESSGQAAEDVLRKFFGRRS
jgi:predicted component of type VI protein secretion system